MPNRRLPLAMLTLLIALVLAACAGATPEPTPAADPARRTDAAPEYARIAPADLAAMLEAGELTLVNVHVPYEGEIPGTDLLIPYDEIADRLEELPAHDARIVVYCMSGPMSRSAAEDLVAAGYTNVLDLEGGMRAWVAAGHELASR